MDKVYHVIAGFVIAFLVAAYFASPVAGVMAAAVAGVAKEMWDAKHPGHTSEIKDAIATIIGGILGGVAGYWVALNVLTNM